MTVHPYNLKTYTKCLLTWQAAFRLPRLWDFNPTNLYPDNLCLVTSPFQWHSYFAHLPGSHTIIRGQKSICSSCSYLYPLYIWGSNIAIWRLTLKVYLPHIWNSNSAIWGSKSSACKLTDNSRFPLHIRLQFNHVRSFTKHLYAYVCVCMYVCVKVI